MTIKQTIAIDIDDVIADSTEALRLSVNERTGAAFINNKPLTDGLAMLALSYYYHIKDPNSFEYYFNLAHGAIDFSTAIAVVDEMTTRCLSLALRVMFFFDRLCDV